MTKSDHLLLQLLRQALSPSFRIDASLLRDADWQEVIDLAFEQGVDAVSADGYHKWLDSGEVEDCLLETDESLEDLKFEWFGSVLQAEDDSRRQEEAIASLAKVYSEAGIRMMVLKGYGLSLNWPNPSHRPTGDIDIYLMEASSQLSPKGKGDKQSLSSGGDLEGAPAWKRGDEVIRKMGIKVDEGHEHHTTFRWAGYTVENHYDFINTKAHKDARRIEDRLKQLASSDMRTVQVGGSAICLPGPDFNVVFLIRHLGQHFAGERITLRQLLDWGLFLQTEGDRVNWQETVPFLKEIGIWTFFGQINAICRDYLGLPLDSLPKADRNEELESLIPKADRNEELETRIPKADRNEELETRIPKTDRNEELETRILEDILHPEFARVKPSALLPALCFKAKRWWHNRWKHPLIYDEWLLPMFLTLLWSHLRRLDTIKD